MLLFQIRLTLYIHDSSSHLQMCSFMYFHLLLLKGLLQKSNLMNNQTVCVSGFYLCSYTVLWKGKGQVCISEGSTKMSISMNLVALCIVMHILWAS